jgi:hypothetical protein
MAPKKTRKPIQETMVEKPTHEQKVPLKPIREKEQEDQENHDDHENEEEQPTPVLFTP